MTIDGIVRICHRRSATMKPSRWRTEEDSMRTPKNRHSKPERIQRSFQESIRCSPKNCTGHLLFPRLQAIREHSRSLPSLLLQVLDEHLHLSRLLAPYPSRRYMPFKSQPYQVSQAVGNSNRSTSRCLLSTTNGIHKAPPPKYISIGVTIGKSGTFMELHWMLLPKWRRWRSLIREQA